MNWIFRNLGEINLYNPKIHSGTQPTRVVHHMLVYMFLNTNKDFFGDFELQIKEGKVNPNLNFIFGEEPIKTGDHKYRLPKVSSITRQIELHETFLSFLWCTVYSIYVRYIET